MKGRLIHIIDDDKNILESLSIALKINGYKVLTSSNWKEVKNVFGHYPVDLVLLDVKIPEKDGLDILRELKEQRKDVMVIMMSGHGSIRTAVDSIKFGAFDFLEKPFSLDKLLHSINNAFEFIDLRRENIELKKELIEKYELVGESRAIKKLLREIELSAGSSGRVLIQGENGTGKELVARLIHEKSDRNKKPFVKVNCAAIPENLIESELFGHEKGAFTDAKERRIGKFELANEGTLFLDEIGDMHYSAQGKVLRVIELGEFERVGGNQTIKVDVRIISATNKELIKEVETERFRQDLYFRLNVIPIRVPPLRERKEDIPILVEHFSKELSFKNNKKVKKISHDALELMKEYDWKGNVRELKNFVERAIIFVDSDTIEVEHVEKLLNLNHSIKKYKKLGSLKSAVDNFERDFILEQLKENNWKITEAAKSMSIERSHLYKKMKLLGIKVP